MCFLVCSSLSATFTIQTPSYNLKENWYKMHLFKFIRCLPPADSGCHTKLAEKKRKKNQNHKIIETAQTEIVW